MSIQAVAWVLENSESTGSDRLVFIAIANHIGPTGWAWPSVPHIAKEARVDRATVFRALDTLEESGELAICRRPGKSNLYGVAAFHKGSQIATVADCDGSQIATGGVASRNKGVADCDPNHKNHKEPLARADAREAAPLIGSPRTDVVYDPDTLEMDEKGRWYVK